MSTEYSEYFRKCSVISVWLLIAHGQQSGWWLIVISFLVFKVELKVAEEHFPVLSVFSCLISAVQTALTLHFLLFMS